MWQFRDFVGANGRNVIEAWLGKQPVGVRAEFTALLTNLANVERHLWRKSECELLSGNYRSAGLYEFKVRLPKRNFYRIGGFFEPNSPQIILCSGWTHAESDGAQNREMSNAVARIALVRQRVAGTVESCLLTKP